MPYQAATEVSLGIEEVAIMLAPGVLGSHLGVAFRTDDGAATLMHLGFHRFFKVEHYPIRTRAWSAAIIPLPPELGAQVLSLLRVYAEKYQRTGQPKPDYGINLKLTEGSIHPDGEYVPREGSDGHTCSTFVAEIFRAARVPLVKLSSWDENDENKAWGEAVVCMLKAYSGTKFGIGSMAVAQAKLIAKHNTGLRLLPEEVAAAAQLPIADLPATQTVVAGPSQVALGEMRAVCDREDAGIYKNCVDNYEKKVQALRQQDTGLSAAKR